MSVHVTSWVLRNSQAHLGDRLVLLVLADHAKEDGTSAWPSVETIGHEAHLSARQARRCLRNLEEAGMIVQTGKSKNGTNVYSVIMGGHIVPRTNPSESLHDLSAEPSLKQPSVKPSAAAPRQPRPANDIWDVLSEIFGEPTTRTAQKVRGKVASSLRSADANRDEILKRAKTWPQHFDNATFTDLALEKHWDTLGRKPLRRR